LLISWGTVTQRCLYVAYLGQRCLRSQTHNQAFLCHALVVKRNKLETACTTMGWQLTVARTHTPCLYARWRHTGRRACGQLARVHSIAAGGVVIFGFCAHTHRRVVVDSLRCVRAFYKRIRVWFVCEWMCSQIFLWTRTQKISMCVWMCVWVFVYINKYAHMHAYIYIYMCMYIYI